jgi:ribosomal protein L11 methylase PrmA
LYDAPYVPTTHEAVGVMLDLAGVTKDDVVYDLGCGDGRIVIAAAKLGARGVGIDIDPRRISEAEVSAKSAGVNERVKFKLGNLFDVNVSDATVIALFLWPNLNLRLRQTLFGQLKPGARIVSNTFDMGDWLPDGKASVCNAAGTYQSPLSRDIYMWISR